MKNKVLALVLSTAIVFSITACGSSTDSRGVQGSTAQEDSNTLTVWAWDRSFNIYAMEEAAKIYQKEHPEFSLNIVEMTETDTQLATIFSSGNLEQLPDIMLAQDYSYQKYLKTYDNLFADLTDSGIDFDQFSEGKLAVSVADGKNYGIPFDNGTEIAAYRVDLLKEAGYTIEDLTDIDWNRFIEIAKDFMKTTFAGSKELYDIILPGAGALSTWLPAAESNVYSQPQEFYGGEPVFEKIMVFASKVPVFDTGIYFTEAGNAISTAATNYCTGADLDTELTTAEETVKFSMGQ